MKNKIEIMSDLRLGILGKLSNKQLKKVTNIVGMAVAIDSIPRSQFLKITSNLELIGMLDRLQGLSSRENVHVKFVIFQKEVVALFPYVNWNDSDTDLINSYQHVGQHGAAYKSLLKCKKASYVEYESLLKELESIYNNEQTRLLVIA